MTALLFPEEQVLRDTILNDLDRGRPGWDRPHTEAVVYWTKELIKTCDADPKVMIAAAYAHDWGYIDLFSEKPDYNAIQNQKALHMVVGSKRIGELLRTMPDAFSKDQIARVMHLVSVHDKLDILKDNDEILLMEVDTLGALDADRVTPTFSKIDNEKYIIEVTQKRRPLFAHPVAIDVYNQLFQLRKEYYDSRFGLAR